MEPLPIVVGFGMLLSGIVAAILFHQPNSYAMWDVWTVIVLLSMLSFWDYRIL